MLDVNFQALLRAEKLVDGIGSGLSDVTRFWSDFVAPAAVEEIEDIFLTGGGGSWAALDADYAARKAGAYPGAGALVRSGVYLKAATDLGHPGNRVESEPLSLVLGVRGDYFRSVFGADYPAFHEFGTTQHAARPVYELIPESDGFENEVSELGEQYQREEIALLTARIFGSV